MSRSDVHSGWRAGLREVKDARPSVLEFNRLEQQLLTALNRHVAAAALGADDGQFVDLLSHQTAAAPQLGPRLVNDQLCAAGDRVGGEELEGELNRIRVHARESTDNQVQAHHAPNLPRLLDFRLDLLQESLNDRHLVQPSAPGVRRMRRISVLTCNMCARSAQGWEKIRNPNGRNKGTREKGRTEDAVACRLVRICERPRTVTLPAAEVFSLACLSFAFVSDFEFPEWLRPTAPSGGQAAGWLTAPARRMLRCDFRRTLWGGPSRCCTTQGPTASVATYHEHPLGWLPSGGANPPTDIGLRHGVSVHRRQLDACSFQAGGEQFGEVHEHFVGDFAIGGAELAEFLRV